MESFQLSSADDLSDADLLSGRDHVLRQMGWMRQYTLQLIESVPEELWYVMPPTTHTHLAWQVGHLAVSEYGLMLFRQRGRTTEDRKIMPGWLRKRYGRGTTAEAKADDAPGPQEWLQRLEDIHRQSLEEVAQLTADQLAEPTEMPYAAFPIKLGALLFCPMHESIHVGQIGMLRRLHGLDPLR